MFFEFLFYYILFRLIERYGLRYVYRLFNLITRKFFKKEIKSLIIETPSENPSDTTSYQFNVTDSKNDINKIKLIMFLCVDHMVKKFFSLYLIFSKVSIINTNFKILSIEWRKSTKGNNN